MSSLLDLDVGQSAVIRGLLGEGGVRQRLMDMGLLPKEVLLLERFAPGGAPIWISIRGSHLALRREEAALVLIEAEVASDA